VSSERPGGEDAQSDEDFAANERDEAAYGLVLPLGEEAMRRAREGEDPVAIAAAALWDGAPHGLSEAEAKAAQSFSKLALEAFIGDEVAGHRIRMAIEAGGPVGVVASAGVEVAREYVSICIARATGAGEEGSAQ
jgi:hypothetical protein